MVVWRLLIGQGWAKYMFLGTSRLQVISLPPFTNDGMMGLDDIGIFFFKSWSYVCVAF